MGIEMAISTSCRDVPKWLGSRMNTRFWRITHDRRSEFYFTYNIFLEGPGCVIGGGGWTGWTGCLAFWGNCLRVAAV